MLYDKYQQKIAVLAKIWKFIKRFRVVIISVVAAIFATTATCLALKGVVYESVPCPKTVVFGEELKYEAGAIFGDVVYQYAPAGTNDWSYEVPSRAGDYKVRAISKRAFGGKGYGKAQPFKIAPRPVEVWVSDTAILYGEDPRVDGDFLGEDYAACTAFTYGDLSKTATTVTPVAENVTVYDAQGNDVTYCYDVRVKTTDIRFASRAITVTTAAGEYTYDGTGHFDEGFELTGDGLGEGEFARVVSHTEAVDAGEHENQLTVEIVGADGETVVTENYKITYEYGTLTVAKRKVRITSGGAEKVYDGKTLSYTHYTLDDTTPLVEGHTFKRSSATVVTDVCEVDNLLEFEFADGSGNDVTKNYDVELTTGKLKITKRPITLTTEDGTAVYDGTPFEKHAYALSADGLAEGHTETVVFSNRQTTVGSVLNQATMTVSTADGGDATGNYEIEYVYGTLEVTVRKVSLKTADHTWVYDGKAHLDESFTLVGETAVAENQTAKAVEAPAITEFGEKSNEFIVHVFAGEENVTANYEFTYEYGTLKIEKRAITVGLKAETFVYDGKPHALRVPVLLNDTTLAEGQQVTVETSGEQTTVGDTVTAITAYKVLAGETDVTGNYEVTLEENTVTVVKRPVHVRTATGSRVYNDEPYFLEEYEVVGADGETLFSFVEEQTVRVASRSEIREVKESGALNQLALKVYLDETETTEVTDNYDLTYDYGTLEVTARPITITTKNAEKIYDGTPLYAIENGVGYAVENGENYGLVSGHFLQVDRYTQIIEVKESGAKNEYAAYRITYETGEEIDLGNYAITENFEGVLTVLKRTVDFKTGDAEKVYDGTPLTEKSWRYYGDTLKLLDGHFLYLVYTGSQTSAVVGENTSANTIDEGKKRVYDSNREDKTDNYELISWYGLLTVHRRQLTYTTASAVWTYNDEDYFNNSYVITDDPDDPDDGLAPNQCFTVLESTVVHNAFNYEMENQFEVDVYDASGESVYENYIVTEVCGTLKVNPRTLTITTQDAEKTYDGKPLYAIEENAGYELSGDGLATGHTLTITAYSSISEVKQSGTYNTYTGWVITRADGTEILLSNYAITVENDGVLRIIPRVLILQTSDKTRVYDGKAWGFADYHIYGEGLAEGEEIRISAFAKIKDVGSCANELTEYKIVRRIDGDLVEVDKTNYDITEIWGTLKVTPRPITVTAGSAEKEYDDTELTSAEYTYTLYGVDVGLAENQTIEVTTSGSQLYKGTSANVIASVVIEDENGEDVTGNYEITLVEGTLTVTPRKVTVTVTDKEKVYDGTALTSNAFTVDRLIESHILTIDTDGSQTDVGESENNVCGWRVMKPIVGGEIDVTDSYEFTFVAGTLKVTPRPITITSASASWVYNDELFTHSVGEVTAGSLAPNQKLYVYGSTGVLDVCENVDNALLYRILNADGAKIDLNNYDVTHEYGKLSVTPRPLTITTQNAEKEYDGTPLYAIEETAGYVIESGENCGLVDAHALTITEYVSITNVWESGTKNNYTAWVITRGNGTEIDLKNYAVTVIADGVLTITPRQIVVTADSASRVYDGTPFTLGSVFADRLVDGHIVTAQTVGEITDVGTVVNTVVEGSVVIEYNGEDVTANYEVLGYETGTLEVFKRTILVKTYGGSRYYDGTAYYNERYEAIDVDNENFFDFLASEEVVVLSHTEITRVKESGTENILVLDILRGGVSNLENYDLQYIYGTLHIQPRPITIMSANADQIYDGTALIKDDYEAVCEIDEKALLGYGDTLEVVVTGSQTVAGIGENAFTVSITNALGEEVSESDYIVSYIYGELTVHKREITLTTEGKTWIYDGSWHQHAVYDIGGMGLADTDEVGAVSYVSIKDVSSKPNGIYVKMQTKLDGEDRTDCYEVTQETFGQLKVEKRTVFVETYGNTWEYDGTPHAEIGYTVTTVEGRESHGFVDFHSVAVRSATTVTAVAESGTQNELGFVVYDEIGEDVTANYEIEIVVYGTLEITPRQIIVTADSATRVYDGTPFTLGSVFADRLVDGHIVTAQTVREITDVGTVSNTVVEGSVAIEYNGEDVTANYEVLGYETGTLEIVKRTIRVQTASNTWGYDGLAHYDEGFAAIGVDNVNYFDFLDGEETVVVSHTEITNAWESGTQNILVLDILRGGVSNLENYEIIYEYGTLEITKREITLVSGGAEKVYDGTALTEESWTYAPFSLQAVEGQEVVLVFAGSQTDVGESENVFTASVKDGETDVSGNYRVLYECGTLKVTSRTLVITTQDAEKEYDGTPLYAIEKDTGYVLSGDGLVAGHTFTVTGYVSIINVSESGTKNDYTAWTIQRADGTAVKLDNYAVTVRATGELRITARAITLTTLSKTKVYDGQTWTYTEHEIGGKGLVTGEEIYVFSSKEAKNVGTVKNEFTDYGILSPYGFVEKENYVISEIWGTLKVTARPITLTAGSAEKEYDGTALTSAEVIAESYGEDRGLVPTHRVTATNYGSRLYVGTAKNTLLSFTIKDELGADVTRNYAVTRVSGTLTVTKRIVTVTVADKEKVYDGTPLTSDEFTADRLFETHTLTIVTNGSQTDVGESSNGVASWTIKDESGKNVASNYELTVEAGTLRVTLRYITLVTDSASWAYDDQYHKNSGYEIAEGSFADGHVLTALGSTEVRDVCTGVENRLFYQILDGDGEDRFQNYFVNQICGTLEITARRIVFRTQTASLEYDGSLRCALELETVDGTSLIDGHLALGEEQTAVKLANVGSESNVLVARIWVQEDGENRVVTNNYEIFYEYGTLEITPRQITVTAGSGAKVYDGTPLTVSTATADRLVKGHILTAQTEGRITEAGAIRNTVVSGTVVITANGEDVTANYEIVGYEIGTLEITPRPITVTAGSTSKVYDGKPLEYDYYVYTPFGKDKGLLGGHTLTAEVVGSQTNASKSANTVVEGSVVITANGVDVTENYEITLEIGYLTVTPIELIYSTGSASKQFDGTPLTNPEVVLHEGNAADGEQISLLAVGEILFAGETLNTAELTVAYTDGTEASAENYLLVPLSYGTLKITPIILKIETGSAEKVYDGEPLTEDSYTWLSGELLEGHTLTVYVHGKQTQIGSSNNTAGIYVYDQSNTNMSDGYEVQWVFGKLTVLRNEELIERITICPASKSKRYDGTPLTPDQNKVKDVEGSDKLYLLLERGYEYEATIIGSQTEIGVGESTITSFTLYDPDGNIVGADKIEVIFEKGTLTVLPPPEEPKTITVRPVDTVKVYDGTPLYPEQEIEKTTGIAELLRQGYRYEVRIEGVQTEIGVGESMITSFTLYDPDGLPVGADEIAVVYETGRLRVTADLLINIYLYEVVEEYDGRDHAYYEDDYWAVMPEGYEDYILDFKLVGSRTEAGEISLSELERLPFSVTAPDGMDVTKLFSLVFEGEPLTVEKREITLTVTSETKIYDGTPLQGKATVTFGSLVAGHIVEYTTKGTITDVGYVKCTIIDVKIYDINGTDVTGNYNITKIDGMLTVVRG